MKLYNLELNDGRNIEVEENKELYKICTENNLFTNGFEVVARLDNEIVSLNYKIDKDAKLTLVDIGDMAGQRAYIRTLTMIFAKAAYEIFPEAKVSIAHAIDTGIYGEIYRKNELKESDLKKIKHRMIEIVEADLKINKQKVLKETAIEMFKQRGFSDKAHLLKYVKEDMVTLYDIDDYYDYYFGVMAYSTGIVKVFDIKLYDKGFIIKLPDTKRLGELAKFTNQRKLFKIFRETEKWCDILGVGSLGALNDHIANGDTKDIIRVNEALHEKKIAYIADSICKDKKIKMVLIAGPSSSGKTTFCNRLSVQLRVNGVKPIPISLDNYFVEREDTPIDEDGKYNFESIYALDLELFNTHLEMLMEGLEVKVPEFDFLTGTKKYSGEAISIPDNGILVIEGIHGLNEKLTSSIDRKNKFKIYLSALTQLNADEHNRISTTDVRMIRRIVRDFQYRGYSAETTLGMWDSIRKGEHENIFVFQEDSDVMFNTTLVYELCVLRNLALGELRKIGKDSKVYSEAERLIGLLSAFEDIDPALVPDNSIIREFIGGSSFY